MTELTDFEITDAMIAFGGSFVSGLGRLWRQADALNKTKLQDAFPEYWQSYSDPVMHAALRAQDERVP